MSLFPRKRIAVTRRALRKVLRRRQAAGRIALVGTVLLGLVVSSAPTAQAVVQTNSAVNATVNGLDSDSASTRGSKVNLKVISPVADPGSLTQSVTQMFDPTRMVLTGLQDIVAPAEWALSYTTDGTTWTNTTPTTTAGWAAVRGVKATGPVVSDGTDGNGLQISTGDATQAYPTGGSVNAAASGDGYNLFFDERGNFYNIWHHNGAGTPGIDCHVRTGARCAGNWPFTWPLGTESGPNTVTKSYGWYDPVDQEIWFSSNMKVNGVGTVGFACVDVRNLAAPGFCGGSKDSGFHGIQAGGVGGSGSPGLGAAAGRIFTLNPSTGDILCLDLRADFGNGAPCSTPSISFPSYPSAQTYAFDGQYGGYAVPTLQALAGRIYAYIPKAVGNDAFACIEPATMAICAGWEGAIAGDPKAAELNTAHIWPLPNAQGEIQAICGGGTWVGCYNFDGTVFTGTKPPSSAIVGSYQLEAYGESDPVVSGSKIFSPRLSGVDTHYISCWDMATNSGCTGINGKRTNIGLYTVNIDPYNETCIWTNTDPGVIQTWDTITGSNSCTPRSIAFDAGVIVPRMGCDSRTGIRSWKEFELTNPPASEYSTALLTVKTEDGTNVTGWVKQPITTGVPVDLSGLAVEQSGQRPKFVVEFTNRVSGTNASAQVSAVGDSPELCLAPTTLKCQPIASPTSGPFSPALLFPSEVLALLGKGDWTTGSSTINQLTDDASSLALPAGNFADCSSKITGTARATSATGAPVSGAKVTLLSSTGTVINYPNDWPDSSLRGTPVTTTTASDGTYDLGWVFPGDYKVKFEDVPTSQVNSTNVVTGTTATTKTTSETTYAITSLASITATPVVGTNAVVDAVYKTLPTLTKKFVPETIAAGGTGAIVFEITNAPGNPAWTGLGFVDTLPAGLVVAAIPNRQYTCPGGGNTIYDNPNQLTAAAGSSIITATNFGLDSGVASCFFSVDVTSATGGTYTNGAGNVTTTGLAPPADATLTATAMTNPNAFPCTDTFYHHESTQLYMNSGPDYSRPYKLGAANGNITGLGFNGLDGYLYGIAGITQGNMTAGHLIRTDNKGTDTDLGALTGPAIPQTNIGGDMDDSGHLLLWGWNDLTKLYVVDVYTRNVTTVTLTNPNPIGSTVLSSLSQDFAYKDGKLYSVLNGYLATIDVATGVISWKAFASNPSLTTTSAFITDDGRFFIYYYNASKLAEITNFEGSATPQLTVLGWGNYAEYSDGTSCHDATPPPATRPDTSYARQGATQTVNPLTNDFASSMVGAELDPNSVKLCADGEVSPNCSATQVTKPEGSYAVNNDGEIVFTPNQNFSGVASGVTYQVSDTEGESSSGKYTPTVVAPPTAVNDATTGAYMAVQTVNPITATGTSDSVGAGAAANGVTLVQNSVRLCGPSETAPNCTQTSVTIDGQGTYTVASSTGVISFTPVQGFYGTATPVTYSITDSLGQKASATYTPTSNVAPRMSKAFGPDTVAAGGVTTLTFTITNTSPAAAWTNLGFVDTLPAGVTVDTNPNVTKTCTSGVVTAAAGSGLITVTGVPLAAASASCSISVDVKVSSTTGTYTNGESNISSSSVMPPSNPAAVKVVTPVSPGGFACNPYVFTQRQGGMLMVQNPITGSSNQVGPSAGGDIQALGFNALDGYLYGYVRAALTSPAVAAGHIIKISSTGTITDVGVPTLNGVALAANPNVYGGDMDDSGNLFFLSNYSATTTAYMVNVSTLVTRQITLSTSIARQDVAFFKGKFYTAETATVYAITPSNSSNSWNVATSSMSPSTSGTQASAYANSAEFFYLANGSGFKLVNNITGTATVTALGADSTTGQADGASCHQAAGLYTPAAYADTITTAYNTSQVYTPLGNDVPSLSGSALSPTSVKLCDTNETVPNCSLTTKSVSGEGTYTVNQTTGAVTFVPLSTFTGTATPVTYQISDTASKTASSTISPIVGPPPPPTAVNDSSVAGQDINQTLNPLTNDTVAPGFNLLASSVKLCAVGTLTNCAASTIVIPDEGTYSVDPATGEITFDPLPNFTGTPTPIGYSVSDNAGQSATASYQPRVIGAPDAANDNSSGAWDTNQVITLLGNDAAATGATLATSPQGICLQATAQASCNASTLTVNGEGTYTLNSNGTVTFDPLPSFTGIATPIKYVVADSIGQLDSALITATVSAAAAPEAEPETEIVIPGGTISFTTVTGTNGLATSGGPAFDTTRTCLYTPGTSTCDADGVVTIAGEGTYTLDQSTGVVTFRADANATPGTKTGVTYKVVDVTGASVMSTLTPIIPPPPVVRDDDVSAQLGSDVTIPLLSNDAPGSSDVDLDPQSIRLCDPTTNPAQTPPNCTATQVVTDQGTFTLDPQTGVLVFDADPNYAGSLPAYPSVDYIVEDELGQFGSGTATVTVLPPPAVTAVPDAQTTDFRTPVVFDVVNNDSPGDLPSAGYRSVGTVELDRTTVRLCEPVTAVCNLTTLSVPGEGVYQVDTTTGQITFTPADTFVGTPISPPTYEVCNDVLGNWNPAPPSTCSTATLTATVTAPDQVVAVDDSPAAGAWDTNQVINVLSNDTKDSLLTLDALSLHLCGPTQSAPNCTLTSLDVPGVGTYTVDQVFGTIIFNPDPTFTGTAAPVTYQISDSFGQTDSAALSTSVTAPAMPVATDSTLQIVAGTPQQFPAITSGSSPLATGTSLQPLQTFLCDTNETAPACSKTSVSIAGVGTYELNQATGVVTFTSVAGTTTASEIDYVVTDVTGQKSTGTLSATPIAAPTTSTDTIQAGYDQTKNVDVLANDNAGTGTQLDPTTLKLCDTGQTPSGCTASTLVLDGVGTYTVQPNGVIQFDPLPSFSGDAPAVTYQISDELGQTASSTLSVTISTVTTTASDDAENGAYDTDIVFTPTANDTPGVTTNLGTRGYTSVGTSTLDLTSVRLCGPNEAAPSCSQLTLTTADGVYTVDPVTGEVTFNPTEDFIGSATQPVSYQVCNTIGTGWNPEPAPSCATATLTATIALPVSALGVDDSPSANWDVPTTLNPLSNDTVDPQLSVDPATLFLCGTGESSPSCTQTELTVPGEGTYTVNPDGTVSFDPEPDFIGNATAVSYQATDSFGQIFTASMAPVVSAPPVPVMTADTSSAGQGQAQTEDLDANDSSTGGVTIDPTTIKLCSIQETAGNCSTPAGTDLVIPGVGTYNVDTDGVITFTPEPEFSGTPRAITYQMTDSAGRVVSSTYTPTVIAAPSLVDDAQTGSYNTAVTKNVLTNDSASTGTSLVPSSLKIFDPSTQTYGTSPVTIDGEGTYSLTSDGQVTFTPLASFAGLATPVTYQVADALGVTSTATFTPNIAAPTAPVATDQTKTVGPTAPAVFTNVIGSNALATGTGLQSWPDAGPQFVCPVSGAATCSATTVVIPGEGTWTINRTTGVAIFTLEAGVSPGTVLTPVDYKVTDVVGQIAVGTLTPEMATPPTAVDDTKTAAYGLPVTDTVLSDDTAAGSNTLVPSSLKIFDPSTQTFGTSDVTISGQGTYSISGSSIVFTPEPSFAGTATSPIEYQITDNLGSTATATYTPTVTPPSAPVVVDDSEAVGQGHPAVFSPILGSGGLATGTNVQSGAVNGPCLIDPADSLCKDEVSTNQGVWTIDQTTGIATFTVDPSVTPGTPIDPITFQVTDIVNQRATGELTAIYPAAPTLVPDTTNGSYDTNQSKSVLSNDSAAQQTTLDASSLKLYDPSTQAYGTTPVTVPEGTYSLSGTTIVFDPNPGFAGTATAVTYQVADALGTTATSTYTPTVSAPAAPQADADTEPVGPSSPAVFTNILYDSTRTLPLATGSGLQAGNSHGPAFVCPMMDGSTAVTTTTCNDTTVVIPGEGTWTMDQATGIATFTLQAGVPAGTSLHAVTYEVTDVVGQTARNTLTPIMPPAPTAEPDASYGQQGDTQFLSLLGNDLPGVQDADLDPTSVLISCPPCGGSAASPSTSITIAGEGTYDVLPNGMIEFTPDPDFTGAGTVITYVVADEVGQTVTSTFQATVWPPPAPTAITDVASAPYGQSVTMSPWLNDHPGTLPVGASEPAPDVVATSLRLCGPSESVPNCSETTVTTDDGTYVVDITTGRVVFTPVSGFVGTVTSPVTYQIANNWTGGAGAGYATAALIPTIAPPGAPSAVDDVVDTPPNAPIVISPLANDVAGDGSLDPSSVRLCDVTEIAPNCSSSRVEVSEGVFEVNTQSGQITFTPNANFDLTHPATISYVVEDSNGLFAMANILVNDPPVANPVEVIANLVHTGLNAETQWPAAVFAAVVGTGMLYYSHQKLKPKASAVAIQGLRDALYTSYETPIQDYAEVEKWLDREHQKDWLNQRPD